MIVITMTTQHFDFVAAGTTRKEAALTMGEAFTKHLMQRTIGETTAELVRENWIWGCDLADEIRPDDADAFAWEVCEHYGARFYDLEKAIAFVDGSPILPSWILSSEK